MDHDLKDFWHRFQSGVDIAVAGNLPEKLLGVRDGFLRYFQARYSHAGPIRVTPRPQDEAAAPLPLEDLEILDLAQTRARDLKRVHDQASAFHVGTETGLLSILKGGETRYLIRTWTVILGLGEEAWGSSGSVQLPQQLFHGLNDESIPFAVPGTRRRGGMLSSLTGDLESRRLATSLATFHALSTLTYDLHETRPASRRRGGLYRV